MRLKGQIKGGFFPAPPDAIKQAIEHIDCKPLAHLCDPCAGEGAALMQLARATGAKPWAIELDEGRTAVLKLSVPEAVAPASAFGIRHQGYFDWLWLNPPYDDEMGGGGRVEQRFIQECSMWLKPKGIICFVIPESILGSYGSSPTSVFMRERFDKVRVMKFPEHCRRFREVIVFGVKRDRVKELSYDERYKSLEPLTDEVYTIEPGHGPRIFEKCELTENELQRALARSPLLKLLQPPAPLQLPRPPLPVAKGHLAMLLASGHMDGLVQPDGEDPHVVRGTATKEQYLKESTEEEKGEATVKREVYAERILLNVRVLTSAGEIVTLKQE